jgi:hypothetical protein
MTTYGSREYNGQALARLSGRVIYDHVGNGRALVSISGYEIREGDGGRRIGYVQGDTLYSDAGSTLATIGWSGASSSRGDVYVDGSASAEEKGAFWMALRYV